MSENDQVQGDQVRGEWPLYEVFLRGKRGLNHVHVGSCARQTIRWPYATRATSTPDVTKA